MGCSTNGREEMYRSVTNYKMSESCINNGSIASTWKLLTVLLVSLVISSSFKFMASDMRINPFVQM